MTPLEYLRAALRRNPSLRVLLTNGVYDLVTTIGQARYAAGHLDAGLHPHSFPLACHRLLKFSHFLFQLRRIHSPHRQTNIDMPYHIINFNVNGMWKFDGIKTPLEYLRAALRRNPSRCGHSFSLNKMEKVL